MTPLIPFAISLAGALFSDRSEGENPDSRYGLAAVSQPKPVTTLVAPTRFTKGTALADIAAAQGSVEKKVLEEPEDEAEDEEEEEEQIDPQEVIDQYFAQQSMIDSIASEVIQDMGLGWDEDREESLPSDEEWLASQEAKKKPKTQSKYGSSYYSARAISPQRLDRIASQVNIFGAMKPTQHGLLKWEKMQNPPAPREYKQNSPRTFADYEWVAKTPPEAVKAGMPSTYFVDSFGIVHWIDDSDNDRYFDAGDATTGRNWVEHQVLRQMQIASEMLEWANRQGIILREDPFQELDLFIPGSRWGIKRRKN